MKKTLLLGSALMIGVVGYAQQQARVKVKAGTKVQRAISLKSPVSTAVEKPTGTASHSTKKVKHNNNVSSCASIPLSSSYASSGILDISTASNSANRNFLTYNKDLNMVAFIHRASKDWITETSIGGSYELGSIQGLWFPAGNPSAQDSAIIYYSSTNTAGANANSFRYPAGTMFNPPGNTNIANASLISTGINLTGSNYVGVCYSTTSLSDPNIYHAKPAPDQTVALYGQAPFGNCGGFNGGNPVDGSLLYCDMQQAGNQVLVAGPLQDATVTTTNGLGVKGAIVVHAKPDGSGGFTWSADSLVPGLYLTSSSQADPTTGDGYVSSLQPRIAFGPDGQTGYAVLFGRLAMTYSTSADSMVSPIVYKTTDGGASWNMVLAGYDWNSKHPEVLQGVGAKIFDPSTPATNFNFVSENPDGCDLAVDANGLLHFVTTVQDVVVDGAYADSLGYEYADTSHYDYINHRPLIWDFMTDGTCWRTMLVDSINTEYISGSASSFSNQFSNWGLASPAEFEGQGAHIQVCRSTDGTKIFYGWADSDPFGQGYGNTSTGLQWNITPDLVMKGFDVNSNMLTAKIDVTNGAEYTYYPYLSDISYVDGSNNWVVPAIYVPQAGDIISSGPQGDVQDVNGTIVYKYSSCGTFAAADFSINANLSSCISGIKSVKANAFDASVTNYPNPFNSTTTIAVNLSEAKSFSINVYNTIGALVYSKTVNGNVGTNNVTFDGSSLNAGVYYYTVNAGNEQTTKKMVIAK